MALSFQGLTVVITGAGGGLGKAYSLLYAQRGANVVVNDVSKDAAQKVVDEIVKAGGKAVVIASSVADGAAVIQTALDAFGGIHILINNAGILRDKSFKNISDAEWDLVQLVHLKGAFSCTRAAWPYFVAQKFGRIINTSSAAGLYGNVGQSNYSAAKMGLVGFTKSLAVEGATFNIKATAIAPIAASAMTATVMPPDMLAGMKPEFVAPVVLALTHPNGPDASGKVFEIGAGFVAEIRWERSTGVNFFEDGSFSLSVVKERWQKIMDYSDSCHPKHFSDFDPAVKLEIAKSGTQLSPSFLSDTSFDGKTVIVTGSGAGLGRAYALMYGKLGANVVVNDIHDKDTLSVTKEIERAGGKAVAVVCSAEDGDLLVKAAVDAFGSVHIIVANAGNAFPNSFGTMTEQEWDAVVAVHLRGTYRVIKASWPIFQKQRYGRIVTTCSHHALYGCSGQANHSAAKAAILGFTRTLAHEGQKYNILANSIAPLTGSGLTGTDFPQEALCSMKPEYVAPVVGYLTSEANEETTGCLFEVAAGWAAQTRWQRAGGNGFPINKPLTPEVVIEKWNIITNFDDGRATHPTTTQEALMQIVENFENTEENQNAYIDPEDSQLVVEAKKQILDPTEYAYTERDIILYNLGIGATEKELQWTYENHDEFQALPTFGVIPQFSASQGIPLDWLPNFNPAKLLHGEQYLSIKGPIPTSGIMINKIRLLEVLDKEKAAAVTTHVETIDQATNRVLFENQSTVYIRGSGGFGGKRSASDRGPATAANLPPKRQPDAVMEEKTAPNQAALYRLSGDTNPLHILPEFAAVGGFDRPILHGLCSMGISGKHVLKTFGPFEDIKVRFAGVVYPGETLVTEMWKEKNKVLFVARVKERQAIVLSNAGATLTSDSEPIKAKL